MASARRTGAAVLLCLSCAWAWAAGQRGFAGTIQDFRSIVTDFRDDGLTGRIRDGVLVDPSPADLKVGDIFIDVDGNARKVSGVTKVGNDTYIDTVRPSFDEVYLYAEIPYQAIDVAGGELRSGAKGSGAAARLLGRKDLNVDVSFQDQIYSKGSSSISLGGEANLKSSLSIGFKAPTYVQVKIRTWKFWEWTVSFSQQDGYVTGELDYDLALTGSLALSLEGKVESDPTLLYGFGSPTSGIVADLGLFTKTVEDGTLTLQLPVTFEVIGSDGAKCTLKGQAPVIWPSAASTWGSNSFSFELDPSVSADANLQQKIYLGASVKLVGISVVDFEAGGGPYFDLNGTVSGSIGYSTSDGLIGPSWSASGTGEFGLFTDVSGELYDGKWSVTLLSQTYPVCQFINLSTGKRASHA
jgi:hypothetical protein